MCGEGGATGLQGVCPAPQVMGMFCAYASLSVLITAFTFGGRRIEANIRMSNDNFCCDLQEIMFSHTSVGT